MGVNIVGEGTGRGSPEMREEFVLGIERDNREGELLEDRSGQGRRGDDSNRGFNDSRQEVLNWDICEWDTVDDFLKLKVDVGVLGFVGGGY